MAKVKHRSLIATTPSRRSPKIPAMPMKEVWFEVPDASKKSGIRKVRYVVPDTSSPEFRREMKRAAKLMKDSPEEQEAQRFCEAAMEECLKNEKF
jgi:hypothetical protein